MLKNHRTILWLALTFILLAGVAMLWLWIFPITPPEKAQNQTPSDTNNNSSTSPKIDDAEDQGQTKSPSQFPINTRPTLSPLNQAVSIGNQDQAKVALTLDAGSGSSQTPQILDILKQYSVQATFFPTGKWAQNNPDLLRRIIQEGHTLGNHTYDHKRLIEISDETILWEFSQTETIIHSITGTSTKPYFRPPYKSYDQHVLDVAANAGYQGIIWTVDALDWDPNSTAELVKNRIYAKLKNGCIILMHVGDNLTPQTLPEIIQEIRNRGYSLGPIESVL